MNDRGLIRISEAARQLGVSAQYLRLLEAEGKTPAVRRVFGCRAFTQDDVAHLRTMGVGSRLRKLKRIEEARGAAQ